MVAINPPGTRLAPLGAARATIPHDQWQAQVHAWMDAARLVVIGSPPSEPTPGLLWELEQVSNRSLWDRLVVVCPPLAPDGLRQRWARLAAAAQDCARRSRRTRCRLPDEPGRVLALVARGGQWLAATGERRDEWSYAAALRLLVETPTGPPPGG